MTPKQLKKLRHSLNLSCAKFAELLEMQGRWDDRTIRRWESREQDVPEWVSMKLRELGVIK